MILTGAGVERDFNVHKSPIDGLMSNQNYSLFGVDPEQPALVSAKTQNLIQANSTLKANN